MSANNSYSDTFLLGKDINGNVTYECPFALTGQSVVLTANTESHITVPNGGYNLALFAFGTGTDVWVDGANTLSGIPSGSTTADLSPVARPVYGGQTLSFYCGTASVAKVNFYKVQS